MELRSEAFKEGERIPAKYTCDGEGVSPSVVFMDVPDNAQRLVLIMEDPDVPKSLREDGMWDHWVVFNMPADTSGIVEGGVPAGVVGKNTREGNAYGPPCPPDREHRYFFKLFALDDELNLDKSATKADVERAMEGHILDSASLMGRYERGCKI
ncbi:MAG: YbhB/YbcL family Raf kinase inhibitor-like protein [Candidatus Harrisonbacteria bacterium CG10_big_fil_rev_8_21_14_0_10_45_28]|uniref:YbhB/YbcL family Raf kinase inhibitor-like protein n=1 Tax=Candidatus Harrisonbacteria bacterium CG10_big_fil_rev_8_21_14_0_10_45_28 TaxID=1974586 RepID=A0A2H0UNA7_9BACT|nr:MAG: YbhB/YbcL family Raf kinase inhibitor-like protein [Candidatus Harrisonbacteria bacterium CG10_big_fil_rev_8_21_14_0_10_45_28]